MKHTEEQIKTIASKVMKDIDGKYYRKNCIDSINFHRENKIRIPKDKTLDTWTIFIKSLFDNIDILIISDEQESLFTIRILIISLLKSLKKMMAVMIIRINL